MITNERQYRIAKAELRRFSEAIESHEPGQPRGDVNPRIHDAMRRSLESEAEELGAQIRHYDDLREGRISERELDSLCDLPSALIEARIAAGLTQKALAERLGLPEQQVQRWEASLYSGVGVERLQRIADALGVRVKETVSYYLPA